jgi:type IV pilus assembly protein PilO
MDLRSFTAQYQNLSKDPGAWPLAPKITALVALIAVMFIAAWFLYWTDQVDALKAAEAKEPQLKEQYRNKMQQAVNLEELRKQKIQVGQYVAALEKQLPSKAEMDALLSDINQAGIGRGLAFELFRPGAAALKPYYAELPIAIKVTGPYHDIGAFASDLAALPRIVTLNNLNIALPQTGNQLALDATAKTFRYLDPEEVAAQQAAEAKNKPQAAGAAAAGAKK